MENKEEIYSGTEAEKNLRIPINLFWIGFIIYAASFSVSATDQISFIVVNLFQIIALGMILPSAVLLMEFKIENSYLRFVFIVYFFWLIAVVLRGISLDYESVKQMLFNPIRGVLQYFVPLVLLFRKSFAFYRRLFDAIYVMGWFYLIFSLLVIKQIISPSNYYLSQGIVEDFSQHLSFVSGFLLLTFIYHSKFRNLFSVFIVFLTFLFAVLRARRGLMFMSFSMLFFAFIVYQYVNKTKVINMVLSIFLVLSLSYLAMKVYQDNRKDTFGLLTERIGDDTRSEVERYFYSDFKTKDWLIGRGMNGQYFCPGVEDGEGRVSVYRGVIETGFLQIILNGGIISLFMFVIIAIPGMIKGIFTSKNLFSKAAGIWIVLFFLYAYPGGPAIFTLNYTLVWLSIGICYSEKIRQMSDTDILALLKSK